MFLISVLTTMVILLALSAFLSCSESAYFSLTEGDRLELAALGKTGRRASKLLDKPEYLLNSILLVNLMVNLLFFTIGSALTFRLGEHSRWAWLIAPATLLAVILFGEVLPKNFGVLQPKFFAVLFAVPLSLLVKTIRPVLPVLSMLNILSRRVLFPRLQPEPYLLAGDLERAVVLSGNDVALLRREQRTIQNLVLLSDMQADELMRPRSLLKIFKPDVSFDDVVAELNGTLPQSGYCLLTEPDCDEIAAALRLTDWIPPQDADAWKKSFENVIYVTWIMSVADVFEQLQRGVAVVINEQGETVGIITFEDILAAIFTRTQERSRLLLNRADMVRVRQNTWQVTELTSLRRLQRRFGISFDAYSSLTVGGLLREILERFPNAGDICTVDRLRFTVAGTEGGLTIHCEIF